MSAYFKSATAVLGAVIMAVASVWTDGVITNPEWVTIAVSGFTAFQVWLTMNVNLPYYIYSKGITAGVLAALGGLAGYLANGLEMSGPLWLNLGIAALTAAGVWTVENDPETIGDPAVVPQDHAPPPPSRPAF